VKNKSIKNVSINLNNSGVNVIITIIVYFPFFLGNFVIKGYRFFMSLESEKKSNRINNSSLFNEPVKHNVFLFDEPLKGSKSLKIFKISLTFRFDKL
jgi:hypothetical protein